MTVTTNSSLVLIQWTNAEKKKIVKTAIVCEKCYSF